MTSTPAIDDRELLARVRAGETSAFDAIFRANYALLVRVAEAMLRERATAEEIAQDVMLELWRRRESLDVTESVRGYLLQATRNRTLNELRHRAIERKSEPEIIENSAHLPSTDAAAREGEIEVALQAAVAELPDRCRQVFELSRVDGLKYAEIATRLGISVKTVEVQMGKALRVLRERLKAWLPAGENL
ncbi:MAG TPA: RNA polymerase sigma-70 factor [Gemmatimonadaceae bacterium]|nr:RNA polymerase sigma-70 factor [Gemmatimonadaceae bacterium]